MGTDLPRVTMASASYRSLHRTPISENSFSSQYLQLDKFYKYVLAKAIPQLLS